MSSHQKIGLVGVARVDFSRVRLGNILPLRATNSAISAIGKAKHQHVSNAWHKVYTLQAGPNLFGKQSGTKGKDFATTWKLAGNFPVRAAVRIQPLIVRH